MPQDIDIAAVETYKALDRLTKIRESEVRAMLNASGDERFGPAAQVLMETVLETLTGTLCNFQGATDNFGSTHDIIDIIEELRVKAIADYERIMGVKYRERELRLKVGG